MKDTNTSLLDLFCGAGGAAMGYHRAGFARILGVDHKPQPRYPFEFVQADALEFLEKHGSEFDLIHASPPCQLFSTASFCRPRRERHHDLLTPTLASLKGQTTQWVVENVPRSAMRCFWIELCGLMFGLKVFRHRLFGSSQLIFSPSHSTHRGKMLGVGGMVCVAGHGGQSSGFGNSRRIPADHRTKAAWSRGIGIDWMTRDELSQAIPPAYTEYLGRQLLQRIAS